MTKAIWLNDEAKLKKTFNDLLNEELIAIDGEGDGMFRYRAKLCTLQIATRDSIYLVDTLSVWNEELFAALLGPQGPEKILHDMAFDARLLKAQGIKLGRVFDTSIAARFLGEEATGLSNMLKNRCNVELCKEQRLTDWGKRPLTEAQEKYLAEDVRYLHRLCASLRNDLLAKDLTEEVAEECLYVLEQAANEPELMSPWMRIKGVRRLLSSQQSVLREIALYREGIAKEWDRPPAMVVHDKALFSLALKGSQTVNQLKKIKQLNKLKKHDLLPGLHEAIEHGLARGKVPREETEELQKPPIQRGKIALRKRVKKALTQWRKGEAEKRNVDPQAILPGHCVSDLVATLPKSPKELAKIDGLGSKRQKKYGETLLTLIAEV